MLDYNDRMLAFDSNTLTYFLSGNRGDYIWAYDPPLTDQYVAAVRLFYYCRPFVSPTVTAEALRISDPVKKEEHLSFISVCLGERPFYDDQMVSIELPCGRAGATPQEALERLSHRRRGRGIRNSCARDERRRL